MTKILGQKLGMTQVFAPDGATVPVTLVHVPPAHITQIKNVEKDGYLAVQVGTDVLDDKKAEKKLSKSVRGHLKKAGVMPRKLYEYRVENADEVKDLKLGEEIKLDQIKAGDAVQVRGTSKGRGFAGVVKRHHFAGGPASHGHKDNLRGPGSIGSQQPQHVWPGTRMAGHMGAEQVFMKDVEVYEVDLEKRVVALKGGLPGSIKSWIDITVTGDKAANSIAERSPIEPKKSGGGKDAKETKSTGDKK